MSVIGDAARLRELEGFCDAMVLWSVTTVDDADPPAALDCPLVVASTGDAQPRLWHRFELSENESTRDYLVDYVTCYRGSTEFAVALKDQGYSSDFYRAGVPMLEGADAFRVFTLALEDEEVRHAITDTLLDRPISRCRVEPKISPRPGIVIYRISVFTVSPETGEEEAALKYETEFDVKMRTAGVFFPGEEE